MMGEDIQQQQQQQQQHMKAKDNQDDIQPNPHTLTKRPSKFMSSDGINVHYIFSLFSWSEPFFERVKAPSADTPFFATPTLFILNGSNLETKLCTISWG